MGSLPNLHELGNRENNTTTIASCCVSKQVKTRHFHKHVVKTRSCGNEPNKINNTPDMENLEHMVAYSPISKMKRKDSLSSSIGATSVRRLLAVVRNGPSNPRKTRTTHFTKHRLIYNLIVLCVSNLIVTATYLPYLALQSSVSVWSSSDPNGLIQTNINIGSVFLSSAHLLASFLSLVLLPLNQLLGANVLLVLCYTCFVGHYAMTFQPVIYVMLPSSFVLAIALGLMSNTHTSTLITIAVKLTNLHRISDEDDEVNAMRFTCLIRRTARAFRGAHDLGLLLGSLITAVIISLTFNGEFNAVNFDNSSTNSTEMEYASFLDDIFDTVEGARLCGSQACPSSFQLDYNSSVVAVVTTRALSGFYVMLCGGAAALVVIGMDALKLDGRTMQLLTCYRAVREAFRDARLVLMAPLMFFIGLEQAFIYADFGKSYVICTLGVHRLNFVYVAMGILQSIAACTLSMLLRSLRRYHIVGVGFTFHSCLMLVLVLWKPMDDDPALFYVISAAWGVCNAIWEMLSFTLLTSLYANDRCWEAAFAVSAFYRFLGLSVAFAFHGLFCNYVKLYGLAFFMVVAVVTFTFLDIKLENGRKLKNISRL